MKSHLPLAALSFTVLLTSCAGVKQSIPPVPAPEKLALVGFQLDKSITATEIGKDQEHDSGPGLLQKDSSYYADHQAALDSIWAKFQVGLPAALGADLLPVSDVVSNPKYAELLQYDPIKILGKDVSLQHNYLKPKGGLRYVSTSTKDTAKLRELAEALGVKKLLVVENKADYRLSTGIGGVGSAKTTLHTTLRFFEVGKGIYWSGYYKADSKSSCAMLAGTISTSNYPKLLPEAVDPILAKISEDAARGRQAPAAK